MLRSIFSYAPTVAVNDTYESLAENFSTRLRAAREAAGLSTSKLAGIVDVTDGAIRQMESGQTKSASFAIGLRIARALGVTPEFLAGEAQPTSDMQIEFPDAVVDMSLVVQGRGAKATIDNDRARAIRAQIRVALSSKLHDASVRTNENEPVRVTQPDSFADRLQELEGQVSLLSSVPDTLEKLGKQIAALAAASRSNDSPQQSRGKKAQSQ